VDLACCMLEELQTAKSEIVIQLQIRKPKKNFNSIVAILRVKWLKVY